MFLLNEFELGVMAYHLEKVGWQLPQGIIVPGNIRLDLNHYSSYNQTGLADFHLHLCCLAFMVKKRVNEVKELQNIQFYLNNKVYISFFTLYNSWSSINDPICQVDPKVLNRLFNRLMGLNEGPKEEKINYNSIVDTIIEISPPYSAKDKKSLIQKKKPEKEKRPAVVLNKKTLPEKSEPKPNDSNQEMLNLLKRRSSESVHSPSYDVSKAFIRDPSSYNIHGLPWLPMLGGASLSTFNPGLMNPFQNFPSEREMWNSMNERQDSFDFFGKMEPLLSGASSSKNELNNLMTGLSTDMFPPEMQGKTSSIRKEGFREPMKSNMAPFPFDFHMGMRNYFQQPTSPLEGGFFKRPEENEKTAQPQFENPNKKRNIFK